MANHIPREFINQLLQRVDIVEVIQERIRVKKAGKNFVACCPFHQEKTPSFNISQPKQFYHCFGCGVSGNVISFLMDYDRIGFLEAIEFLARQAGVEIPYEQGYDKTAVKNNLDDYAVMEKIAEYYQQQLKQNPTAIEYLKNRGLTGEIAKHFNIGFAPNQWDGVLKNFKNEQQLLNCGMIIAKENDAGFYDRFRNRIMFPIRNQRGQIIGFGGRVMDDSTPKYLNSPETHLFQKSKELYGWYQLLHSPQKVKQVVVVEGYLDVISLAQHGITEAVATLGTATSSDHIQKIARQCTNIIFCFDGDQAGRTAAWRALTNTLPVLQDGLDIRFLFLPDGEDPDSYVRKFGNDSFRELYQQAIPFSEYFYQQLSLDCPLNLAEGRAKLIHKATPLLTQIPTSAFYQNLCDELMRLTKIDSNQLKQLLRKAQNSSQSEEKAAYASSIQDNLNSYRIQLTPMRLAISLLLQSPKLHSQFIADKLPFALKANIPGMQLLLQIITICQEIPNISTASLLEHFRDKPEFNTLSKLAMQAVDYENEIQEAMEWHAALKRIEDQSKQHQIDQLLQKMKAEGLNVEEKSLLFSLIKNQ